MFTSNLGEIPILERKNKVNKENRLLLFLLEVANVACSVQVRIGETILRVHSVKSYNKLLSRK